MMPSSRCRKMTALPEIGCSSQGLPSATSTSTRWSWTSHYSGDEQAEGDPDPPRSPIDKNEYEQINRARERLALRDLELRQIIRHCNMEMDIIRRKLCKDLAILEILKGEIEKVGTGPIRDQLEVDFYNGNAQYVYFLMYRISSVCGDIGKTERYG